MIVDIFNERADRLTRVVEIAIISPVYLLLFECFHETLSFRIVVWITDPAHAWLNIMCGEYLSVVAACILGRFKWSSQRLMRSYDDQMEAASLRSFW